MAWVVIVVYVAGLVLIPMLWPSKTNSSDETCMAVAIFWPVLGFFVIILSPILITFFSRLYLREWYVNWRKRRENPLP